MKNGRFYVGLVVVGLAIALGVAFLSPLASSDPDGLERVAEDEEFLDEAHVIIESQHAYDDFYDLSLEDESEMDFDGDFYDDSEY